MQFGLLTVELFSGHFTEKLVKDRLHSRDSVGFPRVGPAENKSGVNDDREFSGLA